MLTFSLLYVRLRAIQTLVLSRIYCILQQLRENEVILLQLSENEVVVHCIRWYIESAFALHV